MLNIAAVFIGGGLGSVIRYFISMFNIKSSTLLFPYATFGVNIVSCFLIGCAMAYILSTNINSVYKCAIVVGFCGGLSTFSALSFEIFEMVKSGHTVFAIGYAVLSFVACILMTVLGFYWVKCYV